MTQPAVLFDVHDVFYDVSQWNHWFAKSLQHIGVDISLHEFWDFDPFPYSDSIDETYGHDLLRFLTDIGLNRGQIEEFHRAVCFQFEAWTRDSKIFADIERTMTRLRCEGVWIGVLSKWRGNAEFSSFLMRRGLLFRLDEIQTCSDSVDEFCESLSGLARRKGQVAFVSRDRQLLEVATNSGANGLGLGWASSESGAWQGLTSLSDLPQILQTDASDSPHESPQQTEQRRVA